MFLRSRASVQRLQPDKLDNKINQLLINHVSSIMFIKPDELPLDKFIPKTIHTKIAETPRRVKNRLQLKKCGSIARSIYNNH